MNIVLDWKSSAKWHFCHLSARSSDSRQSVRLDLPRENRRNVAKRVDDELGTTSLYIIFHVYPLYLLKILGFVFFFYFWRKISRSFRLACSSYLPTVTYRPMIEPIWWERLACCVIIFDWYDNKEIFPVSSRYIQLLDRQQIYSQVAVVKLQINVYDLLCVENAPCRFLSI